MNELFPFGALSEGEKKGRGKRRTQIFFIFWGQKLKKLSEMGRKPRRTEMKRNIGCENEPKNF